MSADYRARDLQELMAFGVRELLLVASPYGSYILEEEGLLAESLDLEYYTLRLRTHPPRITQVNTAQEALDRLGSRPFDLVVTLTRLGDMDVGQFVRAVKLRYPDLPVVFLAENAIDAARGKAAQVDQVFVWHGDVALFLAIVKLEEDRRNADRDIRVGDVRNIILVENSVRFYSSYLPLLYTELMKQITVSRMDGVNNVQRLRRLRARAKVLHAETFEEAWALYERYRSNVLGLITDVRFPRGGRIDSEAGLDLVRRVREIDPELPVLVQSSDDRVATEASALGATFLNKRSPRLLEEVRRFLEVDLGFGDFVFRNAQGTELARVTDLGAMPAAIATVPDESLLYHASRNHFSTWCIARSEFALAARLRPRRLSEFERVADVRQLLVSAFDQCRSEARRGVVVDFSRREYDPSSGFGRIGSGSMGGKGRGLAFAHALLSDPHGVPSIDGMRVSVPSAVVLCTEVFDTFLRSNDLRGLALSEASDEEIDRAFLAAPLPEAIRDDLAVIAERTRHPMAVRSSSLLEDAQDQPFAGVYRTVMIPQSHPDPEVRLAQLCDAIRLVYASTFCQRARSYVEGTLHRMEEEKMAVVLQRMQGRHHENLFYPDLSGVACSVNHYPMGPLRPEDGVATAALGLGMTVVEGERAVRFCPAWPQVLPQFSSPASTLASAQRSFWALDCSPEVATRGAGAVVKADLDVAMAHGTLAPLASVYSHDNNAVYDGLSRRGIPLVTLAPLLKSGRVPLGPTLVALLERATRALSGPAEIEFAVNLGQSDGEPAELAFLQLRPMTAHRDEVDVDVLPEADQSSLLCASNLALGHGGLRNLQDVVYVVPARFDRSRTAEIAHEVAQVNDRLRKSATGYVLVGPGRWGTGDRWLGIPVQWGQISGARAIVETEIEQLPVTPSEGAHFFQNMISAGVRYLHVVPGDPTSHFDHAWLDAQPAILEGKYIRHVRLEAPLDLRVDGRIRRGIIVKPGMSRPTRSPPSFAPELTPR